MRKSPVIMREFEPVTYISTSRSIKRYLLPSRDSPPLRPAYISFAVTSAYSIVSQLQPMIALAGPVKVLSRLLFNSVHDT